MLKPVGTQARILQACLIPAFGTTAPTFDAQQVYKTVDEKGNVIYSQNPPPGKDAKKDDRAPSQRATANGSSARSHESAVLRR